MHCIVPEIGIHLARQLPISEKSFPSGSFNWQERKGNSVGCRQLLEGGGMAMKPMRMGLAVLLIAIIGTGTGIASTLVPGQTWLPGECIPQFETPLPVFGPGYNAALPRVDALRHPALNVKMVETERQVLPTFTSAGSCPSVTIQPTRVFGIRDLGCDHREGSRSCVLARRHGRDEAVRPDAGEVRERPAEFRRSVQDPGSWVSSRMTQRDWSRVSSPWTSRSTGPIHSATRDR